MAQSNSKLSAFEKEDLKAFKAEYPNARFFHSGRVTVLELNGRVTVSIASVNEKKLRPKVGEYWASIRMECGESIPLAVGMVFDSYEAEVLASSVCDQNPHFD